MADVISLDYSEMIVIANFMSFLCQTPVKWVMSVPEEDENGLIVKLHLQRVD